MVPKLRPEGQRILRTAVRQSLRFINYVPTKPAHSGPPTGRTQSCHVSVSPLPGRNLPTCRCLNLADQSTYNRPEADGDGELTPARTAPDQLSGERYTDAQGGTGTNNGASPPAPSDLLLPTSELASISDDTAHFTLRDGGAAASTRGRRDAGGGGGGGCGSDDGTAGYGAGRRVRPRGPRTQPPALPGSSYFLHTTNDSLPRSGVHPGAAGSGGAPAGPSPSPSPSDPAARAQRHADLASSLVQFVATLPAPSPGSAAEALRSRLGSRLSAGALGVWIAHVAEALRDSTHTHTHTHTHTQAQLLSSSDSGSYSGGDSGSAVGHQNAAARADRTGQQTDGAAAPPAGPKSNPTEGLLEPSDAAAERVEALGTGPAGVGSSEPGAAGMSAPGGGAVAAADEALVEAMLAVQPQLLAQDSQVLAARLRGLAGVLGLAPSEALALAATRPGLLLLDTATLERRLEGLRDAMRLPDRGAAAELARRQPAWLYADLPSRPV